MFKGVLQSTAQSWGWLRLVNIFRPIHKDDYSNQRLADGVGSLIQGPSLHDFPMRYHARLISDGCLVTRCCDVDSNLLSAAQVQCIVDLASTRQTNDIDLKSFIIYDYDLYYRFTEFQPCS